MYQQPEMRRSVRHLPDRQTEMQAAVIQIRDIHRVRDHIIVTEASRVRDHIREDPHKDRTEATARIEPAEAATARTEPAEAATVRTEPVEAATVRIEPVEAATVRTEPVEAATARTDRVAVAMVRIEREAAAMVKTDQITAAVMEIDRKAADMSHKISAAVRTVQVVAGLMVAAVVTLEIMRDREIDSERAPHLAAAVSSLQQKTMRRGVTKKSAEMHSRETTAPREI